MRFTVNYQTRLLHRHKRGFTLPFEHWLKDELRPEEWNRGWTAWPKDLSVDSSTTREWGKVWEDFQKGSSWSRPWSLCMVSYSDGVSCSRWLPSERIVACERKSAGTIPSHGQTFRPILAEEASKPRR